MSFKAPQGYMPQLDGLRCFAVLAVLYHHFVGHDYQLPVPSGEIGVQLFFVLSGFLITGILLDCRPDFSRKAAEAETGKGFALRQFYARRFLRIFPLYYAALVAAVLLALVPLSQAWIHALYLTNFYVALRGEWLGAISHFWTLAVEEQFYLFWPWLVLFTPKRWLRPLFLAVIASGLVTRTVLYVAGVNDIALTALVFCSIDTLVIGALLALEQREGAASPLWRWLPMLAVAGAAGMCLYPAGSLFLKETATWDVYRLVLLRSFMALAFAWVVWRTAVGFTWQPIVRLLTSAPVLYLGKISYGIYVIHNFVPAIIGRRLWSRAERWGWPVWQFEVVHFLLCTVITIILAAISWHLMEGPINELKRHFPYTRKPAVKPLPEPVEAVKG